MFDQLKWHLYPSFQMTFFHVFVVGHHDNSLSLLRTSSTFKSLFFFFKCINFHNFVLIFTDLRFEHLKHLISKILLILVIFYTLNCILYVVISLFFIDFWYNVFISKVVISLIYCIILITYKYMMLFSYWICFYENLFINLVVVDLYTIKI